jgi:methionyl-tRNA formyltransferase
MNYKDLRIVYMGTPEFAVAPLEVLLNNGCNIVGVVTAPDKPSGRGLQLNESAVKKFAKEKGLKILQPEKLKSSEFIEELKSLKADLQIVVAFRMLPEIVWSMPPLGTFNLHASLLPQYRGAAPINWAIINGENKTGVTTFFLQHDIDTGNIIFQEEVSIGEDENVGSLYNRLMHIGAELVLKTVKAIADGTAPSIPQTSIEIDNLKHAPKIFKETCHIIWNDTANKIHNLIRGLSPYPGAFFYLINNNEEELLIKVYNSKPEIVSHSFPVGSIISENKKVLKVACINGFVHILELQAAGKKRMSTEEFLRGFKLSPDYRAI